MQASRRDVLMGLAAAAPLPNDTQTKTTLRVIAVLYHTEPPFLLERTRAGILAGSPYGSDVVAWPPERSLEQMDQWGIATAILSNPTQWASFKDEGPDLCRRTNEYS